MRKPNQEVDDRPLLPKRLAAIWREFPERERWGFFLAIREDLADRLIELTYERKDERPCFEKMP